MKRRGQYVCLAAAAVAPVVIVTATTSQAFNSDRPPIHTEITRAALKDIFTEKDGSEALGEIVRGNYNQDFLDEKNLPKAHFDRETFEDTAKLMAARLNLALDDLDKEKKDDALKKIGQVLHALQDFYSHSNWVENHMVGANPTPANVPIFTDLLTKNGQGKFSAGELKANAKFIHPTLVCDFNPQKRPKPHGNDLKKISTGYFPDDQVEKGKCSHKQLNKDSPDERLDVEVKFKDRVLYKNTFWSPRGAAQVADRKMNEFARDPAMRHTKKLLEDLLAAIDARFLAERAAKLKKFLKEDDAKLCLAIDGTATMAAEITGLQAAIATKVSELIAAAAVPELRLVSFADTVTDHGAVTGLDDLNTFIALVNGLTAAGGGDCPDASLSAIEHCLATTPRGGDVITVTDASPLESSAVAARVRDLAAERNIALHFLISGDCGNGGVATYQQLAAGSGGYLFWADGGSSNGESLMEELIDRVDPKLGNVLLVQQSIQPGSLQSWTVPVDGTMERIDFVVHRLSGGSASLQVLDPLATPVPVTDLGTVRVARVVSPTAGEWTLMVTGDVLQVTDYAVSVQTLSDLVLADFSHVEAVLPDPPSEHPSALFFNGSALRDSPVDVVATVAGTAQVEAFELIDFGNCAVEPPPTLPACTSAGLGLAENSNGVFTGTYTPSQPGSLLARVRGTDGSGNPMQRVLRRPLRTSTVTVHPSGTAMPAIPGSPASYHFEVTNSGPAATFDIDPVSASGFPTMVDTPTLTLAADEMEQVHVTVTVPLGTPPTEDPLIVRATSTTDATVTNMGAATLRVPAGELGFSALSSSIGEGGGTATITVVRTGGAAGTVVVDYATTDGSAVASADYSATSGTLSFAPGELSKTFPVPIAADGAAESSETLTVGFDNFLGGALPGDVTEATLTILDDDPCIDGWGPFPGSDTGVVPTDPEQSRCEQKVAKGTAKLIKRLLNCHMKQVGALATGDTFDEEGCESGAVAQFVGKTDTSQCPCVDKNGIAETTGSLLDANNDRIYCDPAGLPIGGDETGTVPTTIAIRKCQDRVTKQAGRLAKAWVKCHVTYAKCKGPFDENACEEQAITKFLKRVARLKGCDGCEDVPDLIDAFEAHLDGANDLVFCQ